MEQRKILSRKRSFLKSLKQMTQLWVLKLKNGGDGEITFLTVANEFLFEGEIITQEEILTLNSLHTYSSSRKSAQVRGQLVFSLFIRDIALLVGSYSLLSVTISPKSFPLPISLPALAFVILYLLYVLGDKGSMINLRIKSYQRVEEELNFWGGSHWK